ncbi:MAG: hypothetical protein HY064_15745 [Bacteroidetes bacterium]|nr:hypothetical protein [Bacteroidota bacterium]
MAPPAETFHDLLGFSLMPGANSNPVSFNIVRKFDDPAKEITAYSISKDQFTSIASGWGDNSANPDHTDFFAKYEIQNCGYHPDTIIHRILYKGGIGCSTVDELWRLGYSEYPYYDQPAQTAPKIGNTYDPNGPGPGWAKEKFSPDEGQQEILKHYGVTFWNDIFYGENAFHLLHDMQDDAWVSAYSGA